MFIVHRFAVEKSPFSPHNCSRLLQYSRAIIFLKRVVRVTGRVMQRDPLERFHCPPPFTVVYFINCVMDLKGSSYDQFHGAAIISRFSRLRTSRFRRFARSVQE
jgi:hypothetical protein